MEVMCLVLFVIVLVCFCILMFGTRYHKGGGGLQNPPHDIPMREHKRKQNERFTYKED